MGTGIKSSKSNFQFSDNEYAYITMSADQSGAGNLDNGDPIFFNTMSNGNITFNPATYQATLKKNRTYRLSCCALFDYSGTTGTCAFQHYNVTSGALVGTMGYGKGVQAASNIDGKSLAHYQITPTVDTIIELRLVSSTALVTINRAYSYWEIQQINIVSPVIQDPSREYAYVSPLLTITAAVAGWTTVYAKAVFKKTSGGIWIMDFWLTGTTAASTTAYPVIAGIDVTVDQVVNVSPNGLTNLGAYLRASDESLRLVKSGNETSWVINGSIILNSKPTVAGIPTDI